VTAIAITLLITIAAFSRQTEEIKMFALTVIAALLVGFFVNQQCYGLAAMVFSATVIAILAGIYEKLPASK
jgi:hypothetical protein